MTTASALLEAFDQQVAWCREPAPFTAHVLQRSREWLARHPEAASAFARLASAEDPAAAALPLRWAGALHHLALQGLLPWARLWPPAPGADHAEQTDALDAAIAAAWAQHRTHCEAALKLPPQTNEVRRSAALLPGLLHIAQHGRLPIVLLEIGASAGLNLWCDRYRYQTASWAWGGAQAPLVLDSDWKGPAPPLDAGLQIARRAGCDAHPIDLAQPGESLRLASFVWPDQPERLDRLRDACAAAQAWQRAEGTAVEPLPAPQFVARELGSLAPGHTTVLMHSIVWQYMAVNEQQAVQAAVEEAGRRASHEAQLAWLRFEPPRAPARVELRCRRWPGGEDRLLAYCHPHGARIEWLG